MGHDTESNSTRSKSGPDARVRRSRTLDRDDATQADPDILEVRGRAVCQGVLRMIESIIVVHSRQAGESQHYGIKATSRAGKSIGKPSRAEWDSVLIATAHSARELPVLTS